VAGVANKIEQWLKQDSLHSSRKNYRSEGLNPHTYLEPINNNFQTYDDALPSLLPTAITYPSGPLHKPTNDRHIPYGYPIDIEMFISQIGLFKLNGN
jgi:hypothetical protein